MVHQRQKDTEELITKKHHWNQIVWKNISDRKDKKIEIKY